MAYTEPTYSIITPVYNEEAIVVNSVMQNISILNAAGVKYEMVIVNDGSSDSSAQLLQQHFGSNPLIKVINHEVNKGFGAAIKTGLYEAGNDLLLCVPADSPLTAEVFEAFKSAAHRADVIVSYRIARLGYTPRMRFNSFVYHLLIEIIFDIHLADFNWIHMYRRKIFAEGGIKIASNGIFMLAEVLIRAQREGYTFYEIPVAQSERITGEASAAKFSVIFKTLAEMFRFIRKG